MKTTVDYCVEKQLNDRARSQVSYFNQTFYAKDSFDIRNQIQKQHPEWKIVCFSWIETTNQGDCKMSWKLPSTKRIERNNKLRLDEFERKTNEILERLEYREAEYALRLSALENREREEMKFIKQFNKLEYIKKDINIERLHKLEHIENNIERFDQFIGELKEYLGIEHTVIPARLFYHKKGEKTK